MSSPARAPRMAPLSSLFALAFVAVAALGSSACEDKAIGRPCEVNTDAGAPMSAIFNRPALECPSRICLKPAREFGVDRVVDTAPFCTAECNSDSDCEDGERRDEKNTADLRCLRGFTCGVATETGPFRCKKVCVCRDFLPSTNIEPPLSCQQQP